MRPGQTVFDYLVCNRASALYDAKTTLLLCQEALAAGQGVDDREEGEDWTPLQRLTWACATRAPMGDVQWTLLDFLLANGADRTRPSPDGNSLLEFILSQKPPCTGIKAYDDSTNKDLARFARALSSGSLAN